MNNIASTSQTTQLRGVPLILARPVWVGVALTILITFISALPYRIQEIHQDPIELNEPPHRNAFRNAQQTL